MTLIGFLFTHIFHILDLIYFKSVYLYTARSNNTKGNCQTAPQVAPSVKGTDEL